MIHVFLLLVLLPLHGARRVPPPPAPPPPARPDIVVFVIDDVGDVDVDVVMGKGWMPNLQALAASGVRYRRFYAHAKCAPTRDSLEFGRYLGMDRGDACAPAVAGLTHHPLDYSIADMLGGQGYATCFIGKDHVGADAVLPWEVAPEARGWASVRAATPVGPTCNVGGSAQPQLDDGVYSTSLTDSTIRCRDAFLAWWAENDGRPRFAVVNFGSAHAPFKYPPSSILPPGYPPCGIACSNRKEYEAEIAGVDFALGQMLAVVPSTAWVLFLGDNGTPGLVPGEDPAVTVATLPTQDPAKVKLTCYEGGVRCPLIVKGPGVVPHESQALVQVADLFPTLAHIVGVQPTVPVQGKTFGATFLGFLGPQAPVFVWNPPPRLDMAMIGPRWKLLTRPDGVEVMFDLLNDPLETLELAPVGLEADALRAARDALLAEGP